LGTISQASSARECKGKSNSNAGRWAVNSMAMPALCGFLGLEVFCRYAVAFADPPLND
jgi:hypothetical protein